MKYILQAGLIYSLFISISCDIFTEFNNVFDPNDSRYLPPMTEFTEGPSEGDTLSENITLFQWRHTDSIYWPDSIDQYRIPASILYSYRINYQRWSPWVSGYDLLEDSIGYWVFDTTNGLHLFEMNMMDDQDYMFEVKSKYPTNIIESEWATRGFSVDALHGPALTMYPLRAIQSSNSSVTVSVKAEDVSQMMGIHVVIDYDPDMLELQSYHIQSEENEFLLESQAENIDDFTFVDHDTNNGLFDLNIALAGGDFNGVSGSGTIIEFVFSPMGITGETWIEILPESTIRNIYNETTMNEIRNGLVIIQNE